MATQTLTLAGKKFVVIPQSEYRQLKERATRNGKPAAKSKKKLTRQERGDVAESIRRLAEPGKISLDELSRELGWNPASLRK